MRIGHGYLFDSAVYALPEMRKGGKERGEAKFYRRGKRRRRRSDGGRGGELRGWGQAEPGGAETRKLTSWYNSHRQTFFPPERLFSLRRIFHQRRSI